MGLHTTLFSGIIAQLNESEVFPAYKKNYEAQKKIKNKNKKHTHEIYTLRRQLAIWIN